MPIARLVVLLIGCTAFALLAAAADDANVVLLQPFFKNNDYSELALSPSGKYIGALVPVHGQVQLAVIDLESKAIRIVASVESGDVVWFAWVNEQRLVLQGAILNESLEYRRNSPLAAVNADGTEFVKLRSGSFYSVLPDKSDDVLVRSYEFDRRYPSLRRLNTKTGRSELLTLGKPGDVVSWVIDRKAVVRAAVTDEKSVGSRVFWRADEASPWIQLGEFKLGEARFFPVGFDGDGTLIVASNIGRDTFAIYRYDTERKTLGEELVAHPQVDLVGGLVFDHRKNRVVGIQYQGTRPGAAWFDENWARLQKTIDMALPDHMNVVSNAGNNRALVYSYSDVDPGSYYLFDADKRRLEFVAARRKAIEPESMPARLPVRYAARDGLEIPSYLTLPKGKDPKNLPLVLYVHGGPFVRGTYWGWTPPAAYIASLGYAVLEPEFRGSTGWGRKLYLAGWKQWGRGMQDDLNDGVDWLVREGTVDPKRVCIMGASYGGYAVMMGLARDPERWRCGINYFGVTDINLYFDVTWSDYAYSDWIEHAAKEMIGDPDKDAAMLKAASPLENAANIRAPVLMAYGLQDRRVPIVHGEKMRDALVAQHKVVDWVVYQEEGHGFQLEKNRFDFYGRVAAFLKTHNPSN